MNNIERLKSGVILSGNYWPENVKVDIVENKNNGYIRIVGSYSKSNQHVDQLIPLKDLENITIIDNLNYFAGESDKFFLSLETLRYRYASLYDPLLAVNISKVDPLPHQIEAVYGYVLKQPRIRFLIADDPGAGKTVMAGLILKELKLRHLVTRILIVCPGHLKDQWKREMKEKFEETFTVIDRNRIESEYHTNFWEKDNQIITSIDFAKQKEILQILSYVNFDLIIVDEAHKMSAYKYGAKTEKSERYKLGEKLSNNTTHLLFLTATPHKGDSENFRLFLDLLEPGFFSTSELIKQSIKNKDNPLFIRRTKEELKDFDGKPLFLHREVKTINFKLSEEEKDLYNELSKYVENEYNKALQNDKKRNVAFALTILQRRFASSIYALLKSLERRKKKLEDLLVNFSEEKEQNNMLTDLDEIEELEESEREKVEQKWESFTVATNKEELKNEINRLNKLIDKASLVIKSEMEGKLKGLKESLEKLQKQVPQKEKRKILIFTESKDTMDYLTTKLKSWGYYVNNIHGGMDIDERIKAERIFKNQTEIMVATEAAGEGINLQFCNLMINYDIPWNPNRLEQRIGRIHRYGQTREVFVHNLVNYETREGKVFKRLFEKIEEIKSALGKDKVFDVLGEIIDSKKFTDALLNAAVNAKTVDEILQEILGFEVNEEYINKIKEDLGETLATHFIDYTFIKEMAQKAKENRLIPEYTQNYFIKAFEKAGGKLEKNKDNTFQIKSIPNEISKITNDENFKRTYGEVSESYPSITFDKEQLRKNSNLEFVSFGHPLFEAVMRWVENSFSDVLQRGAIFYDPDGKLDGYLLFYEGVISDGTGKIVGKRIFSYYYSSKDKKINLFPPSIIWDLKESSQNKEIENINKNEIEEIKDKVYTESIKYLEEYEKEILDERNRQIAIKEKYGIKSLEDLIEQLDSDLVDLLCRKEKGEQVDLPIRNKEEMKKKYEHSLEDLKKLIQKEKLLRKDNPKFLGIIKVIPCILEENKDMRSDAEIESIGMKIVMEYEKNNRRTPEDVSSQNLGFDIRSVDENGNIRYIEVKARAFEGDVALTQNEWFKAQRFGNDYYLYVVFNAANNPQLFIICNPAKNLNPEQKIELVRYIIKKEDIIINRREQNEK